MWNVHIYLVSMGRLELNDPTGKSNTEFIAALHKLSNRFYT